MMVVAVSTPKNSKTAPARQNQNPARPPLLPSESDNALAPRRPKCREVTSRYMSSSSSTSSSSSFTAKRSPSPLISRPVGAATPMQSTPSTIKRAQSVERRRPANSSYSKIGSGNGVEASNTQRMLVKSARSLSVSFQGESFSLQVSKAKPAPSPVSVRKGTPERRKGTPIPARGADQVENSRPLEQQRWPGRLRQPNSMSKSLDCGDSRSRLTKSGVNMNVVRALQNSIDSVLSSDSGNISSEKHFPVSGSDTQSELPLNSDTESVSSGSTSESMGNSGGGKVQRQRGLIVPARFLQETNSKPTSPVSRAVGLKGIGPSKLIVPKKFGIDSPISSPKGVSNTRGQLSPLRGGALRPSSPSKIGTHSATNSPVRGASPSRMRNPVGAMVNSNLGNLNNTPSVLSFAADIRRTTSGEHRIVEVHVLRILYNRLLQWRFANARADSTLAEQRFNAETSLHNARVKTSELLESVRSKRTELQWLKQTLNIISILKGQIVYLEEFSLINQEFARSLSGAIEALQANTLRLPVVSGARADIQKVKDAICSAVDVMQAMASSICLLLSKVGGVNSLVGELANVAANERALLGHCNHLLSAVSAMQVKECSLRTHSLQLERDSPA